MRVVHFGGPAHGTQDNHDSFTPILIPVGVNVEDTIDLWEDLKDGKFPPPDKLGMYVPWISFYNRTYYHWAGTEAAPNWFGKRWWFFWPNRAIAMKLEKETIEYYLSRAQRRLVVWVRNCPTDL